MPWFTYPAISWLASWDHTGRHVHEWGAGNSTLWWASRARTVTAVEHDLAWYERLRHELPSNASISLHSSHEDYAADCPPADIYVIDGICRAACLAKALEHIRDDSMVVLDNSDRHPGLAADMRARGLLQIDFHGFSPGVGFVTCTTAFLGRAIELIALGAQPHKAPGSLRTEIVDPG